MYNAKISCEWTIQARHVKHYIEIIMFEVYVTLLYIKNYKYSDTSNVVIILGKFNVAGISSSGN